jgi:hypothetical protein
MSGDYYGEGEQGNWLIRLGVGLVLGLIGMALFAAYNCQTGPGGRRQLAGLTTAQEMQLGAQAFHEVLKDAQVVTSGPIVKQVRDVTIGRLVPATKNPQFLALLPWETWTRRSATASSACSVPERSTAWSCPTAAARNPRRTGMGCT